MRWWVVIALVAGVALIGQSQEDPVQWERQYYSKPQSEQPGFNKKKWQEIRKDLDYTEGEGEQEEAQENENASGGGERQEAASSGGGWNLFIPGAEYLVYLLGIGAIGLILYYLVFKNLSRTGKKVKKQKATLQEVEEDLEEADVDPLLGDAVKRGNYRLAVRLYYLKCIQSLSAENFIRWEKDKTNGEYLRELKEATLKPDFRQLTLQFDQIWYGEYAIDRAKFESLEQKFKAFLHAIDHHKNRAA